MGLGMVWVLRMQRGSLQHDALGKFAWVGLIVTQGCVANGQFTGDLGRPKCPGREPARKHLQR